MNYYPEFAKLLNDYLYAKDRSSTWLARRLGVQPSTVGRWINHAKRPANPETVIRIADILGIHDKNERQALLAAAGYGYIEHVGHDVNVSSSGSEGKISEQESSAPETPPISKPEPEPEAEEISTPQEPVPVTWGALFATFCYTDGVGGTAHDKAQKLVEHIVASPQLGLKPDHDNPDKFQSDCNPVPEAVEGEDTTPNFHGSLTSFTPIVAHAQDTRIVQLVLSDIPEDAPATDAFKGMLDQLEPLLNDQTIGEITGYTLTYQAVVPEPANEKQTFSDMLATLKLEELITSAKRPHLPANPIPLAETFVLGKKGKVWLINIPNLNDPTLGNQLEKGTVYLALSLRQANDDIVNQVIYQQNADLFMPDLIAHKGYHQIRQYRLYGEQEQISSQIRSLVGQTTEPLQTPKKGILERLRSKIGRQQIPYDQLPALIAQLDRVRISLDRQIHNYDLWAKGVSGGDVLDYHASQLQTMLKELELMIKEGERAIRMRGADFLLLIEQAAQDGWQRLDLSNLGLTELPPEIGRLTDLTFLSLTGNQLTTLPAEIGRLTGLTTLVLSRNELTTLPAEIDQLTNLKSLYLSNNQLTDLPAEIGYLINLNSLDLSLNELTSLPAEITQLTNLISLNLEGNELTALPANMARLSKLTSLDLEGNQLFIPPEILERKDEPAVIINYYLAAQESPKKRLNEAKMLLVGQGGVGKTSLVKRLVDDSYDLHQAKTDGIDIRQWHVTTEEERIRLNVWDFGGQQILHATHQFFLTERSLYLLVLNARQGEQEGRLEYWLKIIQSFGSEAPVIVVINQIDQHPLKLNERGLQYNYPSIKGFVKTSCVTGEGIDQLKELISREVDQLDHVSDFLPGPWFAIKTQLEQMDADYLPYHEYQRLCDKQAVDDEQSQSTLIEFLHDLGIVLCFYNDPRLQLMTILNPEWLTNGVYKILNAKILADSDGVLQRSQLNHILDLVRYPLDKHLFIIDVMRKFELCYDFEGLVDQQFLIPDLLPKQQPDFTWNKAGNLAFQYHYDMLPSSIISRFIVRMKRHVLPQKAWRSGVVLNHKKLDNRALVIANDEQKKIRVWIEGQELNRRTFLSIIRDHFEHIHETIPKIKAEEVVPLLEQPDVTIPYKDLCLLEKRGRHTYYLPKLDAEIDVKRLLDGIEPERERDGQASSSSSESSNKMLSFAECTELVECLLVIPSIADRGTLDTIIEQLRPEIKMNARNSPLNKTYVLNIVKTCLQYPDEMQKLRDILQFFEGDSIPMQRFKEALNRLLPKG